MEDYKWQNVEEIVENKIRQKYRDILQEEFTYKIEEMTG